MSKKLENIKAEEINLSTDGELEISKDLQDAIAGGMSDEEQDMDLADTNYGCGTNIKCSKQTL